MRIRLPEEGKNNNKPNKGKKGSRPKKKRKKRSKNTGWREKDGGKFITAIIGGKLITINCETFEIILPNNFKINANSLEEAKKKAKKFFS